MTDKVTGQCPKTTTFLKRKESRSGIEPRSFRLPAYRLTARPNWLSVQENWWRRFLPLHGEMTRVGDYLLWGSGTAGRRSPGVRLGSLADGPEFMSLPWLGRLLWSVGEVPRVVAEGGWSRMIMMATKMRRGSIYSGPYRPRWSE